MTSPRLQCDFCDELSGGSTNSFARIYGREPASRVLFRSDLFAVTPTLGQIVEGYLLILPLDHFKALADLPSESFHELKAVMERVARALTAAYGRYILFEHGAREATNGGCGIYHAHLHAVPIGSIPDPVRMLKVNFPYEEFDDLHEMRNRSVHLSSYLFYQDSAEKLYVFDTGPLPSQYMRKVLADALQIQIWDWKTAGREDRLLATMDRLRGKFDTASNHPLLLQTNAF